MKMKRNILLNPGPATTTDTVKKALIAPDICPREKEFIDIAVEVGNDLVKVVNGEKDYVCVMLGGSGTAAMDACVNSVVPPGKKILVINNGAYGQRLADIAKAYGIPCVELRYPATQIPDCADIEKTLAQDAQIRCVALVHHETTTGLLNPLREAGAIAKQHGCPFIVDAISSYAGIPINLQDVHVDFFIATANKCLQAMPGLSFVICRKSELEKIREYPPRSYYLNLHEHYAFLRKTGEMRFTPPVQVMYALRQALKEFFQEGVEERYSRYTRNWKVLKRGLRDMGFEFLLNDEQEARILTTVLEPQDPHFNFQEMHDQLYQRGFTIYPGKLGDQKTFRLSVLGDLNERDIKRFLVTLKSVLTRIL